MYTKSASFELSQRAAILGYVNFNNNLYVNFAPFSMIVPVYYQSVKGLALPISA